ncbi:hypothetical protein QWM81_25045 [Streptomyces ficellus]|uniref:Uncharacterized protein n=1 Tax=Streptomyces ficellus TaxID=1977088 RepID=A0ABT7ZCM2_9ACTN|nr:hypothetical protein [Streptomyces ficellus]MDN3297249.1 hypothetical protein [Streptomyces ficellus]
MDTRDTCLGCEHRLSYRQWLSIAWAPVVTVVIDNVLRLIG